MLNILKEELSVGMILTGCSDVNRASPDLLLGAPHLKRI
jgi:L-lactate dehydrogenase (cytochrome)